MKRLFLMLAALALLSAPAFADTNTGGGNDCTGNCAVDPGGSGSTINSTISPTISPTNSNSNSNVVAPVNSNSNSNAVTVAPTITNSNNSSAAANSASNSASNAASNASSSSGGNTQSVNFRSPHQVGSISVAVAASGACTGQATAVSGGFTVFSVGVSHISVDPECAKREAFRLGISSGDPAMMELARKIFMNLDAVKEVLGK